MATCAALVSSADCSQSTGSSIGVCNSHSKPLAGANCSAISFMANTVAAGPNAQLVESHAIQLVGYNMEDERGYWIAKNSWGTGFAAGGFFKVRSTVTCAWVFCSLTLSG